MQMSKKNYIQDIKLVWILYVLQAKGEISLCCSKWNYVTKTATTSLSRSLLINTGSQHPVELVVCKSSITHRHNKYS